jgi:hypothetical protein
MAPFVQMPDTQCPNVSGQETGYQRANHKKPIQLFVATNDIRKHGQDKHDAAPPQRSPVHKEGSLALLSPLLPFQALPVAHCGSDGVEHLRSSANFNWSRSLRG